MKNSMRSLVAAISVLAMFTGSAMANLNQGGDKENKTGNKMAPNENYKHTIPVSEGHVFVNNFTKPEKESFNRNYKQQNQEKRNVKFKEHFTTPAKTNHSSYKHPQGL